MSSSALRWKKFCDLRDQALVRSKRTFCELQVVAVSKLHSAQEITKHLAEIKEFPRDLGENYLQELQEKNAYPELIGLGIRWHFIGNLQSRKIAEIAKCASVIHAVGRVKELEILAQVLSESGKVPNFYFQFNASNESAKNGFDMNQATEALEALERLSLGERCLGLMCSAAPLENVGDAEVRKTFASLRDLRDKYFTGKRLNMGMSSDFEIAIEEGSDVIRVGTLLFGDRI